MAQEDLEVENIGPNLFSTKPGLTYFLQEIQTPIQRVYIYIGTCWMRVSQPRSHLKFLIWVHPAK